MTHWAFAIIYSTGFVLHPFYWLFTTTFYPALLSIISSVSLVGFGMDKI